MDQEFAGEDQRSERGYDFARPRQIGLESRSEPHSKLPDEEYRNKDEPTAPVEAHRTEISWVSHHRKAASGSKQWPAPYNPTAVFCCLVLTAYCRHSAFRLFSAHS